MHSKAQSLNRNVKIEKCEYKRVDNVCLYLFAARTVWLYLVHCKFCGFAYSLDLLPSKYLYNFQTKKETLDNSWPAKELRYANTKFSGSNEVKDFCEIFEGSLAD